MRYLTIQPPVRLLDLPSSATATHTEALKTMFLDQRILAGLDIFEVYDLRAKILKAVTPGDVVEISEEAWLACSPAWNRPQVFSPAYILAAESHVRAWLDAPTTDPRPKAVAPQEAVS